MFSYLLSGRLGEFLAPRPSSVTEIWSLLRSGLFDKALLEIKKPDSSIDINALDPNSGMTVMHFACAGGSVELVAELLSRGADLTVPSVDGNNALHFAALNNRKGIIEILLRSGADPSVPNHTGLLPIELCKGREVKELFLRDRSGIFSPIAIQQTRLMMADYIKSQTPSAPAKQPEGTAEPQSEESMTLELPHQSLPHASSGSSKLPIFNMASEFDNERLSPVSSDSSIDGLGHLTISPPAKIRPVQTHSPHAAPADIMSPLNVRTKSHGKTHVSQLHEVNSDSANSNDEGDYTIVGVSSVKKPPHGTASRPLLYRDVSTESDLLPSEALEALVEAAKAVSTPTASPAKVGIPRLNLQSLAPPPTAPLPSVVSYSASGLSSARGANPDRPAPTVPPLVLSARRGSGESSDRILPASPTGPGGNAINFYQPETGLPVNTLILSPSQSGGGGGHWTAEDDADLVGSGSRSLFTDYNSNNNRSASHRRKQRELTNSLPRRANPFDLTSASGGRTLFPHEDIDQDVEEMQAAVLAAATETALSFQSGRDEYEARRLVIRNCQKLNEKSLRKLLTFDPSLAVSRASDLGALAPDGQTPLHVAAFFGNVEALQILLSMGASAGATCWVRDLQGRTPLHVAAQQGKSEACEFIRAQMRQERRDPVGVDAPTDLAGTTPLGWASIGSKGKPRSGVETLLFKAGDRSILPLTPHSIRAGKSPWKSIQREQQDREREPLVFAFSEANGWTPLMEDRVMICCPVLNHVSWSLFGVFDGHGGSFCSSFLAAGVPALLAREATIVASHHHTSDLDITPEAIHELLTNICTSADEELSKHPRMAVERSETGKITCLDSSGSTGVMALVTAKYVSVANVGDSRAVLAVRPPPPVATSSSLDSPDKSTAVSALSTPGGSSLHEPVVMSTPVDQSGAGQLDYLTASIERLNMSTPLTATPASHYPSSQVRHGIAGAVPYIPGHLQTVEMSHDHKAYLPDERARAEAAGAVVEQVPNSTAYQMSVRGADVKLRMSRSFGDFYLKQASHLPASKQAVIAVPEVITHTRGPADAFLVLACDGIYDVMSSQEVVDFFGEQLGFAGQHDPSVTTQQAAEACDALLAECLNRGTVDNISVVLVVLGAAPIIRSAHHHHHQPVHFYNPVTASGSIASARRHSHNTASHGSSDMVRASHSSDPLHHHVQRSPREYSVDLPITTGSSSGHAHPKSITPPHNFQPTSLNNVFSNVAGSGSKSLHMVSSNHSLSDSDASADIGSPLNTVAGSVAGALNAGRVRKQLQFNDDS